MTKKSILALLLASMMLLSGCSLVLKDQKVDNQLTIIDVNGTLVTKEVFNSVYNYNVYMEEYYNSMMASMFGTSSTVDTNAILEDTISYYINSIIISAKATELGFDQFTADEEAALTAEAESEYNDNLAMIQDMYFADSELEGDALAAEVKNYADANGLSLEQSINSARSAKIEERLRASVTDLVTEVNDDAIQALLDSKVADEKSRYESSLGAWGTAKNAGDTFYYTPAGYRAINVIEIAKAESAEENAKNEAQVKAEELLARITAGEAFNALGEEVKAYVVCGLSTDLDSALVSAAMSLAQKGEISLSTETANSFVLIQYADDVAEHTATLEEVRDQLYEEALDNAKNAAYEQALAQWESEANVKVYRENLSL